VTFPLEDVLGLMEIGTQGGLEGAEALKEYANFWDLVADATGLASTELANADAGLRAVGIAVGDEAEATNAFGFITRHTTQDVADFLKLLEMRGPAIREYNLDIDDTAALLGAMEGELGL